MNPLKGSLSFTIEPQWGGDQTRKASLVHVRANPAADNQMLIAKDGASLRFVFVNGDGLTANIAGWGSGERHVVVTTWDRGVMGLYVDGKSQGTAQYSGVLDVKVDTPMLLGSGQAGSGNFSHFQIYPQGLTPAQITALVAAQR